MIKRRYQLVYTLLRPFFRIYTQLAYHYSAKSAPVLKKDQPAIILSNHNGVFDPFFMALSFRRPIFFVASDHIFRLGLVSTVIRALVAPIPIVKSQMDLRTLRQIREVIQEGGLIGLFPEGNRSYNGRTMYIPPSTGKLIKQLKCTLILYRLDGGYLTTPRWAVYRRKGLMQGQVVRIIEPDELATLSADAVYRLIVASLQVDVFEWQRQYLIPFNGRRLAETLELTLFVCPKCQGLATLISTNDRFYCRCGLEIRYTPLGFFEPLDSWSRQQLNDGRFLDHVAVWDDWQRAILPDLLFNQQTLDATGEHPICSDAQQILVLTERAARSHVVSCGSLALFADRLEFTALAGQNSGRQKQKSSYSFPITSITRMIVHGPQTLQFTTQEGQVWEVRSKIRRSAYKYVLVFHLLQQQLKGEPYGFLGI